MSLRHVSIVPLACVLALASSSGVAHADSAASAPSPTDRAAASTRAAETTRAIGWRMDGDGRYLDASPVTTWSTTRNVVWKRELPSWSNASPVLLRDGELLVTLSEPATVLGIDAATGAIRWKDDLSDVVAKRTEAHDDNGWTTPTPVSDGEHLFTVLGSGVVAAHSLDGERLWARVVQPPVHKWGSSASPVLAGGRLIVQRIDLIALDPATGDEVWRAESAAKWGSPVATTIDGTDIVLTPDGQALRAVDGAHLASDVGSLEYATPVVQDGIAYFIEKRATAVRLPATLDPPVESLQFETLWQSRVKGSRHYASALIHDGLIYAISREQDLTVLDAATGEVLHERRLDLDETSGSNSAYPSITLAGNKLFVGAVNGTMAVLEPGREAREITRNRTEGFRSSPVFDGDRMYLRAFDHLYCIGSGAKQRAAR